MNTKVFPNTFNGKPMFSIYEVDAEGNKKGKFDPDTGKPVEAKPLFNKGIHISSLINKHAAELEEFIRANA